MARVENLRTENKFKKTEIGEIPVDWEVAQLKNHAKTITKGTTPTTYGHSYTNEGVLFLRVENIGEHGEFILKEAKYISHKTDDFLARSKLQAGDILFSIAGALGRVAIVPQDLLPANINQALALVRLEGKNLDKEYLKYILRSKMINSQVGLMAAQLAQANLNLQQVGSIKLPVPTIVEQKKIAQILSTVDNIIEKSKEIIEKEKQLKKGLMQELLTRGIGHRRFKKTKIGEIPMEWKVGKLGNFISISSGEACKYSKNFKEHPYPVYGSNGIMGSYERFNFENGFVIGRVGASGSIQIISNKIWATDNTLLVSVEEKMINKSYLFYYLQRCKLPELATKTAQPLLTQKTLKAINVAIPLLNEQKQIAEILSSVDDKIEKAIANKARLEKLKKGLMQVLLTGKVRVRT